MNSSQNTPSYDLEVKAADERRRLDSSIHELRDRLREKLDVKNNVDEFTREHVPAMSAVAALVALFFGYSVAGMFTRH